MSVDLIPSTGLPRPNGIRQRHNDTGRKFIESEKALVMANIVALMQQRKSRAAIADELDLSVSTVQGYYEQIRDGWLERMAGSFDELRARELREIDDLQAKAEDAYEASKQRRKKTATRADFVGGNKDGTDRNLKPSSQVVAQLDKPEGDPRFLDMILKCIDRRIKLLGLDEPTKFRIHGGVGDVHGRTAVNDRFQVALALVGIAPSHAGSAEAGGLADGDGVGESMDSDYADYETSGVLIS